MNKDNIKTFNMSKNELEAWKKGNYNIPPKTCKMCSTVNPAGNVACYNCQAQF